MVFEQLGIAFIGAVFGVIFGFFISIFWERRKEQRELKKLKKLLRDDFKRLHELMHEKLALILPSLESEKNMELFIEELISKKFNPKFVAEFHIPIEFIFWKTIADSGSLIKLELDEIKHIESTYQFINTNSSFIERDYKRWIDVLGSKIEFVDKLSSVDKKELLTATTEYLSRIELYCQDMIDILDEEAENFDWIKHHMK